MLKAFVAAIAAALFAVGLIVSGALAAGTTDSQTSTDDSKLACTLDVSIVNGKAVVTWTITGASQASIDPLTFKGGAVPLKGTQTIDLTSSVRVFLIAKDAAGHTVPCTADGGKIPANSSPNAGGNGPTTGGGGSTSFSSSSGGGN